MRAQQEKSRQRFYILITVFSASFLVSLLWFYFNRGFEPILAALASIAALAETITLRQRKWIPAIIIFVIAVFLGSTIILVRNLDGWTEAKPMTLTIRSTDETGRAIPRAKVLLFYEGAPFSQFTDSNGVAVFTADSDRVDARLIVESEDYQFHEQIVSLSRSQDINVQLERKDKDNQRVIVRVVNDNTNNPIEGAQVVLIVTGNIYEDTTDSNGLSRFVIEFEQQTVDAELQVTTDEYETRIKTITLQPERVQDIRLNPLTEEIIEVTEIEANERSVLTTPTPSHEEPNVTDVTDVPDPTPTLVAPTIVADTASSSEISGDVAQNIRLTLAHSPFHVTSNLIVKSGVAFIIDPGVVVKFAPGHGLFVEGLLIARGTSDNPIIFTSLKDDTGGDTNGDGAASAPNPGDWRAITFRDTTVDASSIIENSIIKYTGSRSEGAIHLISASPTIVNNTIINNGGYAISADAGSFPTVGNNTLIDNFGNGLEIRADTFSTSGTWANTDIVYSVTGVTNIGENATLTIQPGVIVKFSDNVYIDVFGTLKVQGTPDEQIVLTSIKDDDFGGDTNGDSGSSAPSAGDWTMIRFKDSSNDDNSIIEHAVIQYTGEHRGNRFGAIHLEAASPTIANNLISDSYWYAISTDVSSFPNVSNNELLRNAGNGLEVRSGEMTSSGTWENTDVVYVVTGPITVRNTATLSIASGVIVKFTENAHINVYGSFRSIGTADQKVILTSQKDDLHGGDTNGDGNSSAPTPGDWTMIRFYDDSNDANCIIDHNIIKYAGRHSGNKYGAIHILSASPTISNSTVTDSFFYGIWYDANSSPRLSNNTFDGNIQGNVFQEQ